MLVQRFGPLLIDCRNRLIITCRSWLRQTEVGWAPSEPEKAEWPANHAPIQKGSLHSLTGTAVGIAKAKADGKRWGGKESRSAHQTDAAKTQRSQ